MPQYTVLERLYAHLRHRLRIPDPQRLASAVAKRHHDDARDLAETLTRSAAKQAKQSKGDIQTIVNGLEALKRAVAAQAHTLDKVQERLHDTVKRQWRLELAHGADRLILRRIDARVSGLGAAAAPAAAAPDSDETESPVPPDTADVPPIARVETPAIDDEWMVLAACPACGSAAGGPVVCEYNRFLVHGNPPDPDFHIYNYTLCRHCGIVYAARRPRGERYRRLLHTFTESLGRATQSGNLLLNPKPLSEEDRRELDRRAARGVFVSEHAGVERREFLPSLQRDRLAMAPHVELLGSLLPLKEARVVEVRSRTGALLAALRRLYGADVMAVPIFESQQHVLRQVYDIPADALIDFERFALPYDGRFELIIANHMVTHALHPLAMLRELRTHMEAGDHLYLYNEPDEMECLDLKQSMFKILNPFHMQTFDAASLLRLLARAGFEPIHLCHTDAVYLQCLARAIDPIEPLPLPASEYNRRVSAYAHARDIAILQAPPHARDAFGAEREAALERASVAGLIDVDERGRLRFEH
jgi:hypothetical protein